MGKIYKSAADLIGNTPLVEVGHIEEKFGLKARVLVKLEYFNATGSVKDRVAKKMIEDASGRIEVFKFCQNRRFKIIIRRKICGVDYRCFTDKLCYIVINI